MVIIFKKLIIIVYTEINNMIMGKHISDGFLLLFCKTDCFFGQSKHKQSLIHPKFEHFR